MKLIVSLSLILITLQVKSQVTSRLQINSGSSVYFYFNSFNKYENGITYTDWTKVKIFYEDLGGITNWVLDAGAMSLKIYGDAGNELELNTIELEANGDALNTYYPKSFLVQQPTTERLALGPETASTNVNITYHCGVTNKLLGFPSDNYFVDIQLTLYKEP